MAAQREPFAFPELVLDTMAEARARSTRRLYALKWSTSQPRLSAWLIRRTSEASDPRRSWVLGASGRGSVVPSVSALYLANPQEVGAPGWLAMVFSCLLSSVACELALLKIVLLSVFFTYFYSFYTCNVCKDYLRQKNTFGHWTALH